MTEALATQIRASTVRQVRINTNAWAKQFAKDRNAALRSASWGIGIMGENYGAAGFQSVEEMT